MGKSVFKLLDLLLLVKGKIYIVNFASSIKPEYLKASQSNVRLINGES